MDKLFDFENGKLFLDYPNFPKFDITIRKPITIVLGDSATGKSMLVSLINQIIDNSVLEKCTDSINIKTFRTEIDLESIKSLEGYLIIIDRADLILTDKKDVLEFINQDIKNCYLIFGRNSYGLSLSPNYFAEFVPSEDFSEIRTNYKYSERGWF